jgi:hypothetical protein
VRAARVGWCTEMRARNADTDTGNQW